MGSQERKRSRSTDRAETQSDKSAKNAATPHDQRVGRHLTQDSVNAQTRGDVLHELLRAFLAEQNNEHLIDHLLNHHNMRGRSEPTVPQFIEQDRLAYAAPEKLYVGHASDLQESIFAYLNVKNARLPIEFYAEKLDSESWKIERKDVGQFNLVFPFNKTTPSNNPFDLTKNEIHRLNTMIRWHFFAANVLKPTIDDPKDSKRLNIQMQTALRYVDDQVNAQKTREAVKTQKVSSGLTSGLSGLSRVIDRSSKSELPGRSFPNVQASYSVEANKTASYSSDTSTSRITTTLSSTAEHARRDKKRSADCAGIADSDDDGDDMD